MTTQGIKRKLTAILCADAAGNSGLVRQDGEAPISTLPSYRSAIRFRGC
jgi:hypothetical protein